jgi:hypothetical protein
MLMIGCERLKGS